MKSVRIERTKRKKSTTTRRLPRMAKAAKPKKAAPAFPERNGESIPPMAISEASALVDAARAAKPEKATPFDCGEVDQKAPLMTLVRAMFSAPDMPCEFKDPGADFMANVLLSLADDAELYSATNGELDRSVVIDRAMMRLDYRGRIAVEIARRLQTGEVTQ